MICTPISLNCIFHVRVPPGFTFLPLLANLSRLCPHVRTTDEAGAVLNSCRLTLCMKFRDLSEKERCPFCKGPSYVFLQQRLLPFLVETPELVRPFTDVYCRTPDVADGDWWTVLEPL